MLSYSLTGTETLTRKINGMDAPLVNALLAAINTGLKKVRDDAKSLAPVDTGELRDSIVVINATKTDSGAVVARADHASYVEFGTTKMAAQPFLFPALESNKAYIERTLKSDGKVAIRKAV